eukprot:CAMPEP_0119002734 /NCGR_PEP_ID=MMETSP1176-20130426/86_1 /TAXON_ID=265551 /ORGANISM="Synedropsis recta cf, Strain CCMP1620" /LENGTH=124 /DNA_ID=CAMNT_0006954245 /DNA_START=72 /DNA_END=446 /DNA_ORIENTATION=-
MKFIALLLAFLSTAAAFGTGPLSRKGFFSAAAATLAAPLVASAGTMGQENVSSPTEVWETGSPSAEAYAARKARFSNSRTQMDSSFPPIKRLTLERKSPVTRLDINAPNFDAYKKSYPGLYKKL